MSWNEVSFCLYQTARFLNDDAVSVMVRGRRATRAEQTDTSSEEVNVAMCIDNIQNIYTVLAKFVLLRVFLQGNNQFHRSLMFMNIHLRTKWNMAQKCRWSIRQRTISNREGRKENSIKIILKRKQTMTICLFKDMVQHCIAVLPQNYSLLRKKAFLKYTFYCWLGSYSEELDVKLKKRRVENNFLQELYKWFLFGRNTTQNVMILGHH